MDHRRGAPFSIGVCLAKKNSNVAHNGWRTDEHVDAVTSDVDAVTGHYDHHAALEDAPTGD